MSCGNGASAKSSPDMEAQQRSACVQCADLPSNMQLKLKDLRENTELCDVVLVAGEREFTAHRVVLAASSPYFHAMFTNAHLESKTKRISLNCIEPHALETILHFIYSSMLDISEDNVQSLLSGASLLQMNPVVEACCDFLEARLDSDNCLGIASFAEMHGCRKLQDLSRLYAQEHFEETSQTEEFLSAPASILTGLISSEDLRVKKEEEVLDAVLQWFHHDELKREKEVSSLLQFVKLPLIPWETIKLKLISDQRITSDPLSLELITQAKNFQKIPDYPIDSYSDEDFNPYVPRKSVTNRMLIYVVGGEANPGRSTVNTVEEYNPAKDIWREIRPMSINRRGLGLAIMNGLLYAVGGSDGVQALRSVECYNPNTNIWCSVCDLNEARSSVAAAVIGNDLYVVGGYDGIMSCLSSAEKYNVETKTWQYIADMNTPRSMMSLSALNDSLYAIGGYDGSSDLASCEMYNCNTNTWVMIEEMHSLRCMAGTGVIDNLIYVVGGSQQSQTLNSMEVYDPKENLWHTAAAMAECRSGVGVAVVGKKIYAVGGYSGLSYSGTTECYDLEKKSWMYVASPQISRRRFGCCS